MIQRHPYHLVDPSPWPFMASLSAFSLVISLTLYMHSYKAAELCLSFSFLMICYSFYVWWRDVVREASFQGHHTFKVQLGIKYGVILFIVSEVMFFLAFFWAFFHSALAPSIEVGGIWPPKGIETFNPWQIPFANTLILLTSGATVTWAHHALLSGETKQVNYALFATLFLAIFFTALQGFEYVNAQFTISDSVYGSTFFMATGFHGFHVFIGSLFLLVSLLRNAANHFTPTHHIGFEAAAWYWHFVDVVWLFLFISIYWWGGI